MIMISKQTSSSIIVIALALVYATNPSVANHEQINKLVSTRSNSVSTLSVVLGKSLLFHYIHFSQIDFPAGTTIAAGS
jgi:hypothetical protein